MSTVVYNSENLAALGRYRENNAAGVGPPIELDENHPMNAPADRFWMLIHVIFFWVLLIAVIEYRLHCLCCDPRKLREISMQENDEFFGRTQKGLEDVDDELPNESDSSEVA